MYLENWQNATGEMLLLCGVLCAGATSALSVQLPCVVTGHKSPRSTLKNQVYGTVFIYKVTSVKVRKISEHCALSKIFYFCRGEREDQQ